MEQQKPIRQKSYDLVASIFNMNVLAMPCHAMHTYGLLAVFDAKTVVNLFNQLIYVDVGYCFLLCVCAK